YSTERRVPCAPIRPRSGDPHVLRAQSLVAAAGIEDDRLPLAQLLEHRAVPDGAPMHEIFLAVLVLNKPEALIRNHFRNASSHRCPFPRSIRSLRLLRRVAFDVDRPRTLRAIRH